MPLQCDVAILGLNYAPERTGIGPYTTALATGLARADFQVTAHVAHPHYPEWSVSAGYGQWIRSEVLGGVQIQRRMHYVPQSPRGVKRLISELSYGIRIVVARWRRPRVVVAVSPSLFSTALAVLRLQLSLRRPELIVWVQDIYTLGLKETDEGNDLVHRITRSVESYTLRAADHIVVIHERFREFVTSDLGVDSSRVSVIRNWTHLAPAAPVDHRQAKAALGWPCNVTLAVHTGNMGAKQGLENIVDAARRADERNEAVHFVLVGDGGERRKLQDYACGVSCITFVDPLDEAEYRLALSAADVLLVNEKPGVCSMAVPSKLTSYFDAGRPVVAATDPAGTTASEIEAAQAGLIVRAGAPDDLLDAVLNVVANPEISQAFGSNARHYRDTELDERMAIAKWTRLVKAIAKT